MRVALYARVSSDGQSLESQRVDLLAGLRPGDQLVRDEAADRDVFEDHAEYSGTIDRPALLRLRDLIADGHVDQLRVWARDRLMRAGSLQEEIEYLTLLQEFQKGRVTLADVHGTPLQGESDEAIFFDRLMALKDGMDRRAIRRRTDRGRQLHYERGDVVATGRFYWLQWDLASRQYILKENEAAVVQRMVTWLLDEGASFRTIAHRLTDAGIPSAGGKHWSYSTVAHILRNPALMGKAAQRRTQIVDPPPGSPPRRRRANRRDRPVDEWLYVNVPAVIDAATFERIRVQLAENSMHSPRNNKKHTYHLRGLIHCVYDGRKWSGTTPHNTRRYQCPERAHYQVIDGGSGTRCPAPWVNAEAIETLVWADLQELLRDPETVLARLASLHESDPQHYQQLQDELDDIDKRQLPAQARERDTVLDWLRKLPMLYTTETAAAEMQKVADQEARILERRAELETRLGRRRLTRGQLADAQFYIRRVAENLDAEADRNAVLRLLINRIDFDGHEAVIHYAIPAKEQALHVEHRTTVPVRFA
jgi:site-specific DNA recombinase